jgi:hypothetical protein
MLSLSISLASSVDLLGPGLQSCRHHQVAAAKSRKLELWFLNPLPAVLESSFKYPAAANIVHKLRNALNRSWQIAIGACSFGTAAMQVGEPASEAGALQYSSR